MIRLLHTADWHLGKMLFGRSMLEDQRYFIDNYFFAELERLEFGKRPGCDDCVVIAGDIFDRSVAPVAALALFDETITRLSDMGIKLFAVTGNHDGAARLSMGTRLMRSSGIYIYTSLGDINESLALDDGNGVRAVLHPLPHFDISQGRDLLGEGSPTRYAEVFSRVSGMTDISDKNAYHIVAGMIDASEANAYHVVAAHCTVLGTLPTGNGSVGGSDEIASADLSRFDIALLGHLHSDISVSERIAYSGSPLAYSFKNADHTQSMRLWELDADGVRSEKLMIEKPLHPLRVLTGSFDELTGDGVPADDAYIFARLKDSRLIYEPVARLREKYPNILGMAYEATETGETSAEYRDYLRGGLRSRSIGDDEVFEAFVKQMCGAEPDEEDLALFRQLCRETATEVE